MPLIEIPAFSFGNFRMPLIKKHHSFGTRNAQLQETETKWPNFRGYHPGLDKYINQRDVSPIPYGLIHQMTLAIKDIEAKIAYEVSTRVLKTDTPLSYDEVHDYVHEELSLDSNVKLYLQAYEEPEEDEREFPDLLQLTSNGQVSKPKFENCDIRVYQAFPENFKWSVALVQVLEEMGILPIDWMLLQLGMSEPSFTGRAELAERRLQSKEWSSVINSIMEEMEEKWSGYFRLSFTSVLIDVRASIIPEEQKLVNLVTPNVFGDLTGSIMALSIS
ncbi:hypothetical protein TWF481_005347 [Arthrobotrys musiformis]|uniref:Uncharacterized protein n=1 Tax=Arthrobotrys musiformis TaxID=47236 RepID=A0AAV9WFI3_9PEZI